MLYGRDPPQVTRYQVQLSDSPLVQQQLLNRDALPRSLKERLACAQNFMKFFADKKHKDLYFEIGDLVLVKLQPYRQYSVALRRNQKLGRKYFGPFQVLEQIGSVAYRLALPMEARIHNVFHVSVLKTFKGTTTDSYIPVKDLPIAAVPKLIPSLVLDARMLIRGSIQIPQVLITWNSAPPSTATWEDFCVICQAFPNFHLEDKVIFWGGSIVIKKNINEREHEGTTGKHGEFVTVDENVASDPLSKGKRRSSHRSISHKR